MITRSIYIPEGSARMYAHPRIGWHTILPHCNLTASSTQGDRIVRLISNYLTYDCWEAATGGDNWLEIISPTSVMVDYMGLACHNFAESQTSYKLQYHNGTTWEDITAEILPEQDMPFLYEFEPIIASRFRLVMHSESAPYIGIMFLGQIMHFELGMYVGHKIASYSWDDNILNLESDSGHYIGRQIISRGGTTTIKVDHMTHEYLRTIWLPFQEHARRYPFFFAWYPELYPFEVIYCWSTDMPSVTVGGHHWVTTSMSIRGIVSKMGMYE